MKTISSQLNTHLGLDCTTLATLWKVKRTDGVILGFTNFDQDLVFDLGDGDGAITYAAATGMTPSATETASDLGTDNLEITAFLDSSAIEVQDVRAGLYDFATIDVMLVNFNDLTMGCLKLRAGTLGQVKMINGLFTAEIRGLSFFFSTVLVTTFGPICRADLGDAQCTVDLGPLTQSGVVSVVTDRRTFDPLAQLSPPVALTGAAGYFDGGVLTWTSGDNNTYKMEVGTWDGTAVELFESMPFDIQVGDTFTIEPGCNKLPGTTGDCNAKFSNIINFQGEPFIPGQDSILQYPDAVV